LERNLLRYAAWMGECGHESLVFAVADSPVARAAQRFEAFERQPRYFAGPSAWRLARRLRALNVEGLWVRDPRDLAFAGMAARRAGIPLIFQQGMQFSKAKHTPWHARRFGRVSRWVAPAHWLAEQAARLTPLRADQLTTIPLALDDAWFAAPHDTAARTRWNWPDEVQIVGLFGRFDPLKGQAELLHALAQAPGVHGWFVGESTVNEGRSYEDELRALTAELGLTDRVRFSPPTEDLRSAYDAIDAFAMCSTSETFGMVTLEALARGCFVIGTRSGGTPELLRDQPGTALYDPGDVAALAAHLRNLPHHRFTRDLASHSKSQALAAWNRLLSELTS
jgi:glycosyltransferase involved in cell wall biosynthesis